MTKVAAEHTLIVPPTYLADIIGVNAIRVGARKVWATLQGGAEISIRRKLLTAQVDGNFLALANDFLNVYRSTQR